MAAASVDTWLDPLAGGKLTAIIVGGLGVAMALFFYNRKATRDRRLLEEQMGRTLSGMDGAADDDLVSTDKNGVLTDVQNAPDEEGPSGDNTPVIDLHGCHPVTVEAWENFQLVKAAFEAGGEVSQTVFSEGIETMRKSLTVFEEHLPAAHGCSVNCYQLLANCYMNSRQWDLAEKLCNRAVVRMEAGLTSEIRQTTINLCWHLGTIYFVGESKGVRKEQGINAYRKALRLLEDMTHLSWRPLEISTFQRLGMQLLDAGFPKDAAAEFNGALEVLDDHENPVARANILRGLALSLAADKEFALADSKINEACVLSKAISVELLEKMFVARASIKMMQKQYNVAEPFFKKALDMTEARGAPWPEWCGIASELAQTYAHQRKFHPAHHLYERLLQINVKFNGNEHPSILGPMTDVAMMTWAMGDFERAKDLFFQASRLSTKIFDKNHANTTRLRNWIKRVRNGDAYDGIGS